MVLVYFQMNHKIVIAKNREGSYEVIDSIWEDLSNYVEKSLEERSEEKNEVTMASKKAADADTVSLTHGSPTSLASSDGVYDCHSGSYTNVLGALTTFSEKNLQAVRVKEKVTAYILFSAEVTKNIIAENPYATFGEFNKVVGTKWTNLPDSVRKEYEERAQKMNDDMVAQEKAIENSLFESTLGSPTHLAASDDMCNCLTGSYTNPSEALIPPEKKLKVVGVKNMVTGYILYSSSMRKVFAAENPDATFGVISKIVGTAWRNLPDMVKKDYEEKAQKINEKTMAQKEAAKTAHAATLVDIPSGSLSSLEVSDCAYDCCWGTCIKQFEDFTDFTDHLLTEKYGHVFQSYSPSDTSFQCLWKCCGRIRKKKAPFPDLSRIVRHVKEVHIEKAKAKPVDENKLYIPSKKKNVAKSQVENTAERNGPNVNSMLFNTTAVQATQANNPVFTPVPARPLRLLHGEAYLHMLKI